MVLTSRKYSVQAIGSGQLSGKGLNNDDPSSLNNAHYIAEGHTDFIFAVMGRGAGFYRLLYGQFFCCHGIVIECIIAAVRAKDFCRTLICCGVAAQIGFQSALKYCSCNTITAKTQDSRYLFFLVTVLHLWFLHTFSNGALY